MAAGYTKIVYNGVTLKNVLTRQFEQEAIRDESGTDIIYHKFTIRVVGYVTVSRTTGGTAPIRSTVGTDPAFDTSSATANFNAIRHLLGEARKPFEMRMGVIDADLANAIPGSPGTVLLSCQAASRERTVDRDTDLDNGPKPRVLSVSHFASDECFKVEFAIEICKLECQSSGYEIKVLSNRWSVRDEIDADFRTTRTFTGILKTSAALHNPNNFRGLVVPPLMGGMRRNRMIFEVSPDCLTLRYTIEDYEVFFSAPKPATRWEYTHSEAIDSGMVIHSSIDIRLWGDRNTNRSQLLRLAGGIADAKVLSAPVDAILQYVDHFEIVDHTSDSEVYIGLTVRLRRAHKNQLWRAIPIQTFGRSLDHPDFAKYFDEPYDSNVSRGGRDGETPETAGPVSVAGAFACYLQDPCDPAEKRIASGDKPKKSSSSSDNKIPIEVRSYGQALQTESDEILSAEQFEAPYVHWHAESHYVVDEGKIQLPLSIADDSANSRTSVVCALHAPIYQRVVRIQGERVGKPPVFPTPKDIDTNPRQSLLSWRWIPQAPDLTPSQVPVFRVAAEYVYGLSGKPPEGAPLPIGPTPWAAQEYQTAEPAANFKGNA